MAMITIKTKQLNIDEISDLKVAFEEAIMYHMEGYCLQFILQSDENKSYKSCANCPGKKVCTMLKTAQKYLDKKYIHERIKEKCELS